jgi:hypothetical protein
LADVDRPQVMELVNREELTLRMDSNGRWATLALTLPPRSTRVIAVGPVP